MVTDGKEDQSLSTKLNSKIYLAGREQAPKWLKQGNMQFIYSLCRLKIQYLLFTKGYNYNKHLPPGYGETFPVFL